MKEFLYERLNSACLPTPPLLAGAAVPVLYFMNKVNTKFMNHGFENKILTTHVIHIIVCLNERSAQELSLILTQTL
jgi:hypothetical protein